MDLPPQFLLFVAIGLAAQAIDGALGMAYGLTSSSLLLALGVPPALASASVHAAEVATTGVSGLSHGIVGNVHRPLLWQLVIPGAAGGALGACLLSHVDFSWLRPLLGAYLCVMGIGLARDAWRGRRRRAAVGDPRPIGFGAGFLDAVGGGGWGSLITPHLIARAIEPRLAIGTANAAEFFVSVAISAVFVGALGLAHVPVVLGLLLGGVIAAPLAAWTTRHLPARPLMAAVGVLVALLGAHHLFGFER